MLPLQRFPYEMKKIFDRILHGLQYLDREHPHHVAPSTVSLWNEEDI